MDIEDAVAVNQAEDLEYDQEEDQEVQVNNPAKPTPQILSTAPGNQNTKPSQKEDEPSSASEQAEVDHTPSFFSQRFAHGLLGT